MTEAQIRAKVVETAAAWLGCNESDGSHRKIVDVYNSHTPRVRGYKVKYTDAWCATFVSAVGIACGLTDIMPPECSCSRMISLYKTLGRWQESDAHVPSAGDLVMYDWEDSGAGDNKGNPNHVGIVEGVTDGVIRVIEGNLGDAVAYRELPVNGKYIRGFCLPDYACKATEEAPAVPEEFAPEKLPEKYGKAITVTLHQLSKGCRGEEVRALQILLMGRGYDVGKSGADGSFGGDTEKAVLQYQRDHGLKVDGYAGEDTLTALWRG